MQRQHSQRLFVVSVAVVALSSRELEHAQEVEFEEVCVLVDEDVLANSLEDSSSLLLWEQLLGGVHQPELHGQLRSEQVQQERVFLLTDLRKVDGAVRIGESRELDLGLFLFVREPLGNDPGAVQLPQNLQGFGLLVQ